MSTCCSPVVKVKSRQDLARDSREDVSQHDFSVTEISSQSRSKGRMEMLRASLDSSHSEAVGDVHS